MNIISAFSFRRKNFTYPFIQIRNTDLKTHHNYTSMEINYEISRFSVKNRKIRKFVVLLRDLSYIDRSYYAVNADERKINIGLI